MNEVLGHAWPAFVLTAAWSGIGICLAGYGFNSLWLAVRALCHVRRVAGETEIPDGPWPAVTVQIPLYNEQHVARRVIDCCARLEYPNDLLQIQVLDDSEDRTRHLAEGRVQYWRERGMNIDLLPRSERNGYKAGALQAALGTATGDFICLFDADFQPHPQFLKAVLAPMLQPGRERCGFVQARWTSANRHRSRLTDAVTVALEGHFAVETRARCLQSHWFAFNGSGGIWRRQCLEDPAVGGWSTASLCEDLDLSYRAQLAGWQGRYLDSVAVAADAPERWADFRSQQFRWAKGSVQTLLRLAGPVLRSGRLPPWHRLQAMFHMAGYLVHPLLLAGLLLVGPLLALDANFPRWLPWLIPAAFGPLALLAAGQWRLRRPLGWDLAASCNVLLLAGVGLCWSNSVAVWEAARHRPSEFLRTPKPDSQTAAPAAYVRDPWPLENRMLVPEILLLLYAGLVLGAAIHARAPAIGWVALLGLLGLGSVVWNTWRDRWHRGRWSRIRAGGSEHARPGHI